MRSGAGWWQRSTVEALPAVSHFAQAGASAAAAPPAQDWWARVLEAIEAAPQAACAVAAQVLPLLDEAQPEERRVAEALGRCAAQTQTGGADAQVCADFVRALPTLLVKRRREAALDEIRRLHEAGHLSEEDYVRASMSLVSC